LVSFWKGFLKPLALAGITFTAFAGFVHWMVEGPNEVDPKDEEMGRRMLDQQGTGTSSSERQP
jgi:formate dehydrogenase iron-sulfur subunit